MARPSDLFRQTITYAAVTGRDAYGQPTLGAKSTAAARVQPARRFIRDKAGNQIVAAYCVYTTVELGESYRIWLPGEDTSSLMASRRVLAVDAYADGAGVIAFYKVWL